MQTSIAPLAALVLGAAGWTLAEYLLHRFVFHGPSAKRLGAREHRQHHAQVDYFAPWWQKALAALGATAIVFPLAVGLAGAGTGLCFTVGFIAMYLTYEVLHRRAHTHPPRGVYGRWMRRNHFAHHFMDPRLAQGVTVPIWDVVFGTTLEVGKVRVPRRLAMPWLVDEQRELRPAFEADYELVGPARGDDRSRKADVEAAMANRSPA
ncbi:MAG: sterol desaturase family protein [Myxococcota bacterium]